MNKLFTFDAPAFEITKSYRDDNGQMFIEGIASTVSIDQTGERMSPEVIAKMAARLVGKPLRDEHQKGWYDKMGEIIEADVVDHQGNPALWIKARLYDWSTKAKDLFQMLKSGGQMGLSVAGKINPGGLVREIVRGVGKLIPTYKDVEPTEVSVTDHPANLDTFALAVAKSLNLDEYDPNEYAKDALCEHGAMKKECTKCTELVKMGIEGAGAIPESKLAAQDLAGKKKKESTTEKADDDVANAHDSKPKEYADVAPADFLDPENYKYPADEKHVMPALRYFNQKGQREAGGYDEAKWKSMGEKLAAKLERMTGDRYTYDSSKEKVARGDTEKAKEVINKMDKGNLVSKNIPDNIKMLAKEWGKDIDKEMKKTETTAEEKVVAKSEETKTTDTVEKGSSFSAPSMSPIGSSSSSTDSSSSDSSNSDSSGSDSSSGSSKSDWSSILSELQSTLDAIKSSLSTSSSGSSDSSTSSGSSSSDSSSDKTSTDKAMSDSMSSASSSDDDQMARAIDSLVQAANTMRENLAKKKGGNKPKLADSDLGASSDYSTSDNVSGKVEGRAAKAMPNTKDGANGTQHQKPVGGDKGFGGQQGAATDSTSSANADGGPLGKALLNAVDLMQQMQKSLAKREEEFSKLVEKQAAPQERKGYAITVEKNFTGHNDVGAKAPSDELYEKMKEDKEVNFTEQLMYKEYGILPKKYKQVAKN